MFRDLLRVLLTPIKRYCDRHLVMWLDMGGDAPPPPDYTPVANASKEAAEIAARLGQAQLDEARYQYDANMAIARPVVEAQLGIMQQTADQGRDYYEYGKTFRPLEQNMLRQVQGQLTPAQIVRLGVSGLNLPTSLTGKAQSASTIAGAGQGATPAPAPAPGAQTAPSIPAQGQASATPSAPIMRFASGQRSAGPRFPSGGILSMLSSQDMNAMLGQQGGDPAAPSPTAPTTRPTLPAMPARPPATTTAPAPAPAFDSEAFKNDMLAVIDDRLKKIAPQYSSGSDFAS